MAGGRPAAAGRGRRRLRALRNGSDAIWDDILPPVPEELWRANLAAVARSLAAGD